MYLLCSSSDIGESVFGEMFCHRHQPVPVKEQVDDDRSSEGQRQPFMNYHTGQEWVGYRNEGSKDDDIEN